MQTEFPHDLSLVSHSGEYYSASGMCRLLHAVKQINRKNVDNQTRVCKSINDSSGATPNDELQISQSDPA